MQRDLLDAQSLHKRETNHNIEEIRILREKIEDSEKSHDLSNQKNSFEVASLKLRIADLENTIKDLEATRHKESTAHEERALQIEKVPEGLEDYVNRIREEFHLLVKTK